MSNTFYVIPKNSDLQHHGIKGQQWGIRNGPPYPIEDKVLKKGTSINSVSGYSNSDEYKKSSKIKYLKKKSNEYKLKAGLGAVMAPLSSLRAIQTIKEIDKLIKQNEELTPEAQNKIYTFNPNDKHDSAIYKGPFSWYLMRYKGIQKVYEHKFETVKDLKMPNSTERFNAFKDLMNTNNKNEYAKELNDYYNKALGWGLASAKNIQDRRSQNKNPLDFNNLKSKQDFIDAFTIFNSAIEEPASKKICKEFLNVMSKNYDAMVDDNNVNIYNDAHDPIIIFNAAINLIQKENPSEIKMSELTKNYDEIERYMNNQGKKILL